MGSTIQLNITVPPAAAGFAQEGTGLYSQGIQLHLSITMPMTTSTIPIVQTTQASPSPTQYIDSNLTEREADLRHTLKQRRLNTITNGVVASVPEAVLVAASLHPAPPHNRAGSEGTSTDATLCSNGFHSSGNNEQIVEDEARNMDHRYSHTELPVTVAGIDTGSLQQETTMANDSHRVQPHTPPGSPYRLRSASLQSRAERGRSRESKTIGYHRDTSTYSCQSRDCSSARSSSPSYQSRRPHSPTRQPRSASRSSARSSSTSLALSHHVERDDTVQEPPASLILRVDTRGGDGSTRTKHESSESLAHRIGNSHSRRICPFFHKNEQSRHPNHEPHPGYSEEEFDAVVKLYARGEDLPPALIKDTVEVNWKNHKRNFAQSHTQGTSSPMKRRFERTIQRPSFTSDNFERPNKRQRLAQSPYEARDHGPPRYDASPRDPYEYGGRYTEPPEYSPRLSPLRHQFSPPNDSRQQYQSDYFMNAPSRGIYERPHGAHPHW